MNRIAKFLFTATAFAPAMFVYGVVWAMDGCFLDSGRYNSPVTNSTRVTNSHRAADR